MGTWLSTSNPSYISFECVDYDILNLISFCFLILVYGCSFLFVRLANLMIISFFQPARFLLSAHWLSFCFIQSVYNSLFSCQQLQFPFLSGVWTWLSFSRSTTFSSFSPCIPVLPYVCLPLTGNNNNNHNNLWSTYHYNAYHKHNASVYEIYCKTEVWKYLIGNLKHKKYRQRNNWCGCITFILVAIESMAHFLCLEVRYLICGTQQMPHPLPTAGSRTKETKRCSEARRSYSLSLQLCPFDILW